MNKVVYKYPLDARTGGGFAWAFLELPVDCRITHVGEQNNKVFLWAHVDPDRRTVRRKFAIVGTGHETPANGTFVGTVQMQSGLVWHIFEEH